MRTEKFIICFSVVAVVIAALCGMAQFAAHADEHALTEKLRQRSIAQCEAAGSGRMYRTPDGLYWCEI